MNWIKLIAASIWTLPISLWGLGTILFGGVKFHHWERGWVPVFTMTQGEVASESMKLFGGFAVSTFIFMHPGRVDHPEAMRHELRHVTQHLWFGPLLIIVWPVVVAYAYVTTGDYYYTNWFERDARAHEKDAGQ